MYYNLEQNPAGIESRFKDRVVKFSYLNFTTRLGLTFEGTNMYVARSPDYNGISFMQSTSKSVCDQLGMVNFNIRQVRFDMRILH